MADKLSTEQQTQIDHKHIWHPFTQMQDWKQETPLIIDSAIGNYLIDVDGNRYLDGVSSLWCNVHGHNHPKIIKALKEQLHKVCHSTLLGLSHTPIIELSERLARITPGDLNRFFYADSGSTAVEAALRITLEYWHNETNGNTTKRRFASLKNGYHGDTLGAIGVGFLEEFHSPLREVTCPSFQTPPPHVFRFYEGMQEDAALEASISALSNLFEQHADEIAAFIIEPLVQGATGIWVQPVEYLQQVHSLCNKHNILLIADEVATGFGKTGKMFAVEHAGIEPDLMVLGKGLSGGYLPISAVCTSDRIFQAFSGSPEKLKTFFYGQTFAGNPLAAKAATANLDIFRNNPIMAETQNRIATFKALLKKHITPLTHVDEVRNLGLMTGIELTKTPGQHDPYKPDERIGLKIVAEARKRGALIRPLGNVMVLMPALSMTCYQLTELIDITRESILSVLGD